jgi:hypothetical protein
MDSQLLGPGVLLVVISGKVKQGPGMTGQLNLALGTWFSKTQRMILLFFPHPLLDVYLHCLHLM